MNIAEADIVNIITEDGYKNQRILAEKTGYSLGIVNKSLRELLTSGYLDEKMNPTVKLKRMLRDKKTQNAIILAAGFGMRMVPINMEIPKGLLEVKKEPLIERLICQLQEAGIENICVVVGFMKEKYEYLMDEYGVKLIVNSEYADKNNLYSLKKALPYIKNSYIVPCDIWCEENPFRRTEFYSWYMVSSQMDQESSIYVNRKRELVKNDKNQMGNRMIGIAYLTESDADRISERICKLCEKESNKDAFWEEALFEERDVTVYAREVSDEKVIEINTYEQLRELDSNSDHLHSEAIKIIEETFQVNSEEIKNIQVLKKGMTNRSFLFECQGKTYIMRIPGEGTDKLINRQQEADVYEQINKQGICDHVVYMNPENGYKITEFVENARVCDASNLEDIQKCMYRLRNFHELKLKVPHEFDLFAQIEFYESLWNGEKSVYRDYKKTKEQVLELKPYIEKHCKEKVLTHIDAVPDNFLFSTGVDGSEKIYLIDWEYAGMQDPHVDIAMFCIYAMYTREEIDRLINIYFEENCDREIRIKIYCYIAVCGLLWSNWCEYKRNLGVEFGEYSLRQYRYAKEYYKIVQDEWKKEAQKNA